MSSNLTKKEIVSLINEKSGYNQQEVRDVVQGTLDIISQALLDGRNVELRNFGVFEVQVRRARVGRNPNKPEKDVIIPQRPVIKFKTGKELKEKLEKKEIESFQ